MDQSRVFIASSDKALTLAEKLSDALRTGFSEPTLWSNEVRGRPSSTIIEMLENASATYDFAVIILTKDDVMATNLGAKLETRDNCVFEAGLFMGGLGRRRCFLASSVPNKDLPVDLRGIIYLSFEEPNDLTEREACAKKLENVASTIKDAIQSARREGITAKNKAIVSLLSWSELIEKEKLDAEEGGELEEGQVVVTAIQPVEVKYRPARQVRRNIDHGVSYTYFFHGDGNSPQNICRLLQMVLLAPLFESENEADDYAARLKKLRENQERVLGDLKAICEAQTMTIVALPEPPILQYCIHNAKNVDTATAYLKYGEKFLQWAKGKQAHDFWNEVEKRHAVEPKATLALFYEAKPGLSGKKRDYYCGIESYMAKYFPGIDNQVRQLSVEGISRRPPA
jgi:hypothetical protein